ncbi:MAG: hypothetical protein RL095_3702, partial [Verrucomicrobiota bacterium]
TVLTTSGAPSAGTGTNGDFAYDPTAKIMYGPKAAGAWPAGVSLQGPQGTAGTNGTNGADGKTVLTTSGAPSAGTGTNGDFAYDPTAKIMYGPKAAGAWPAGVSLQGPQGTAGTNGTNGANGQGVPTGGTAGQFLTKIDGTDFNTQWGDLPNTTVTAGSYFGGGFTVDAKGRLTAAYSSPVESYLVDLHAQSNIATLSGAQTVDGYTTTSGEIVNCTAQTTTSQNGPWITSSGAWTRPAWWANGSVQKTGISFRASGKGSNWSSQRGQEVFVTNATDITVGTTGVTFSQPVTAEANSLSLGKWWGAASQAISFYANGGTTARASITAASGANGTLTIANTGSGTISFTQGGVQVGYFSSTGAQFLQAATFGGGLNATGSFNTGTTRVTATGTTSLGANSPPHVLFDAASTLATATVTFPASPNDGQEVTISSGAFGVTTLTLNGNGKTVNSPITTLAAHSWAKYKYVSAGNAWYRVG